MPNATKRNPGFDCLRLICAFCVVCLHVAYPFKHLAEPWIRFAVPVFFMLSGYFYEGQRDHGKQIRKILFLCIGANLLHLGFQLLLNRISGHSSAGLLGSLGNLQVWMEFLLLNHSPVSSPLWYLGALLYVLVIMGLLDKGPGRKAMYPLIPVLLGLNLILGTYSPVFFGRPLSIEISRNFLFAGLPFFLLGDLLRTETAAPGIPVFLTLAAGLVLSFLENYLLYKLGLLVNQDLFLGTIPVSCALFRLTAASSSRFENRLCRALAGWGHRCSLGIYILPMVILGCRAFLSRFGAHFPALNRAYILFAPVIVFSLSFLLCTIWNRITKKHPVQK